jgi:hypothetical protein
MTKFIAVLTGVLALLLLGSTAQAQAPKPAPYVPSYRVVQKSEVAASNPELSVEVYCDWQNGERATGGGGQVPRDQNPAVKWVLVDTNPIMENDTRNPIGWRVEALRTGGDTTTVGSVTAYAVCVNAAAPTG